MAGEAVLSPEVQEQIAREEATKYLQSRSVPGYSSPVSDPNMPDQMPPPAASQPAGPPPPPPPPPPPNRLASNEFAVGFGTNGDADPGKPKGGLPPAPPGPIGPPRPPPRPRGEQDVIDLGKGPGSAPGRMTPAGFQPDMLSTQVHLGKQVPEDAKADYGTAAGLQIEAAGQERDAAKAMYQHQRDLTYAQMQGNEDAAAQHARVQSQRDTMVSSRLAQIEALNKEAQGSPSDMFVEKAMVARLVGTLISALSLGLMGVIKPRRGSAGEALGAMAATKPGQIIDGIINTDMQARLQARKSAGDAAGRQTNILELHLHQLGDQDKAIEATRLAYYDSVLQQMEMYKAEHGASVSDANYNALVADILNRRADTQRNIAVQETADVQQGLTHKWHQAQMIGGGEKKVDEILKQLKPGSTVDIPPSEATDQDSPSGKGIKVSIKDEATATRLQKVGGSVGAIMKMNTQASMLLAERDRALKEHRFDDYRRINSTLESIAEDKASYASVKNEQGVLREPEYVRSRAHTVGWGSHDPINPLSQSVEQQQKFLRAQNEQLYQQFSGEVAAAGGSVVEHRFIKNPKTGLPEKVQIETARTYEPDVVRPELK